jgi:uncharacterized protein
MKLHADQHPSLKCFTSHGTGYVAVNLERFELPLLVLPDRVEPGWTSRGFDALELRDFAYLAACGAEIVLLGTGSRQRFLRPSLLLPLMEKGIGFEVMNTAAACRTYNILAGEGRKVAAALLMDAP